MYMGDMCKDFELDMNLDRIYKSLAGKLPNTYESDLEDVINMLDYLIPYRLLDTAIELKKLETLAEKYDCKIKIGEQLSDEEVENFKKFKEIALENFIVSERKLEYLGEINLLNGVEIGLDLRGKKLKEGI